MRYVLMIYTGKGYGEVTLPNVNNTNWSFSLQASDYGLPRDLTMKLEVMDNEWRFIRSSDYRILYDDGQHNEAYYEGKSLQKDMILAIRLSDGEKLICFVWEGKETLTAYRKFQVMQDIISIGRQAGREICYEAQEIIGREHARIEYKDRKIYLTDLSRNGTYLNHQKLKKDIPYELHFGDVINMYGLSIWVLGRVIAISSLKGTAEVNPEALKEVTYVEIGDKTQSRAHRGKAETTIHLSPRKLPKIHEGEVSIEQVPQKKEGDKKPAWMSILPSFTMVLPMLLGYMLMSHGNASMGIVIAGGSALVGGTWAIINYRYAKKSIREEEMTRLNRYEEYLVQTADEIREKYIENRDNIVNLYPDAEACVTYKENSSELWTRNPDHSDFLFIRLGLGDMPFQIEINAKKNEFTMQDDELSERPAMLAESFKILHDVPLGVSLKDNSVVGVITGENQNRADELFRVMMVQLAVTHCYTDVRIAYLGDNDKKNDYIRWLPHLWNEERTMRYYSEDEHGAVEVLNELAQVLRARSERMESSHSMRKKIPLPHYVIFVKNQHILENKPITKYLFENGQELGITTILFEDHYENLPSACDYVIESNAESDCIYAIQEGGDERRFICFDSVDYDQTVSMAKCFSAMKVSQVESRSDIPSSLTFFEMMGVSTLEEMNVLDRWKKNRTYESMQALVGQKQGGLSCYLDINEKFHGPHGLVAGTTGSGKSETLQTFLLSLCINFSPQDVGLFIIDYKGGGMANLFTKLPHTVGTISNLSGSQIRRAMVSITSEIARRQTIFNNYGVNHLDGYTKLVKSKEATIPIPHLLIVIDEFAELKREEPEFMSKLISVSQTGRSLGIHLILATQKPGGTVDDNIRSNTKFKLCLRVADKTDSNEVIHKPDAAFLTQSGRCYLQVGNDEIFELFQSGWSGAPYETDIAGNGNCAILINDQGLPSSSISKVKSERKKKLVYNWIEQLVEAANQVCEEEKVFLDSDNPQILELIGNSMIDKLNKTAEVFKDTEQNRRRLTALLRSMKDVKGNAKGVAAKLIASYNKKGAQLPEIKEITQLDAVVGYLAEVAKSSGLENPQRLWLPELPARMELDQLKKYRDSRFCNGNWLPHKAFELHAYMGMVDDPENQQQYPLLVDLQRKGHLIVAGSATSGKSTFMQSLVYSLISTYSPAELNVYGIDYSAQMLYAFDKDAHVGGIVLEGEEDKLNKLFVLMMQLLAERKKIIKGGNFTQYCMVQGQTMPAIMFCIDGYANFKEKTGNRFESHLIELARSAENYGIYLVISCNTVNSADLQSKVADNMRQGITLELKDKYEYGIFLKTSHFEVLPESNVAGRGLCSEEGSVLEYQTALAKNLDDYARTEWIQKQCRMMTASWTGKWASVIPEIPENPTWDLYTENPAYKELLADRSLLPVGYYQEDATLFSIDLKRIFCYLILGRERSGKTVMLRNIVCAAMDLGADVTFIDKYSMDDRRTADYSGADYCASAEQMYNTVKKLILATNERGAYRKELLAQGMDEEDIWTAMNERFQPMFFVISDLVDFFTNIYIDQGYKKLNAPVENILEKGRLLNVYFIAAVNDSQRPEAMTKPAYSKFIKDKMGIVLGGELAKQNLFSAMNIHFKEKEKKLKPGMAYAVDYEDNSNMNLVVIPQNKGIR